MSNAPMYGPVVLDFSEHEDYAVLIGALDDYAQEMSSKADDEANAARYEGTEPSSMETRFREISAQALRLRDQINRQLDTNAHTRPGA